VRLFPRFSLRTFVIMVTLACVLIGTWPLTQKLVDQRFRPTPVPFVVQGNFALATRPGVVDYSFRYHVWLFGITIPLPIERTVSVPVFQSADEIVEASYGTVRW
jgi:hypothetical protein